MTNPFKDQIELMQAAEQTTDRYNAAQTELYVNLIVEEFQEAVAAVSLENFIKELNDLIVVTIGCLYSIGVDAEQSWQLVHASNMSKLPFTKREDGKILKGPNYQPADLVPLVMAIQGLPEEDLVRTEGELDEVEATLDEIEEQG